MHIIFFELVVRCTLLSFLIIKEKPIELDEFIRNRNCIFFAKLITNKYDNRIIIIHLYYNNIPHGSHHEKTLHGPTCCHSNYELFFDPKLHCRVATP